MGRVTARRLPDRAAGHGVGLRRLEVDDAPLLHAAVVASTEHLRPWMPWIAAEPQTLQQRRDLISAWEHRWEQGGDATFGIFTGRLLVGGCGLHRRVGPRGLEIGYWVHVGHVGRGYATKAAALLTTAAFSDPEVGFVEIHHDKANVRSAGVPRRLGFTMLGERPDEISAPGEVGVDCQWQVSRHDWPGTALGSVLGGLGRQR
jgi:ribosomal-protein-serine acetyltransferase